MSMEKLIAVNRAEGTRRNHFENAKINKKDASKQWELEYEHVYEQTDDAESRRRHWRSPS